MRTTARIKLVADKLLQETGTTKPPVMPSRIARHLGLQVVLAPAQEGLSGFLLVDHSTGNRVIGVNAAHHVHRQRFTLAHEIGHHVLEHEGRLHIDEDRKISLNARSPLSSTGENSDEVEANAFAAELLMPEQFLRNDLRVLRPYQGDDDKLIRELAKKYKVSVAAMTFRLANLAGCGL